MRTQYLLAAGALVLLGLSACDKNPAAEAARDHSERLAALPYEDRASSGAEARSFRAEPVSAREEARERAPAPLVNGRPSVGFEDVKAVVQPVLNHRLILNYQARFDRMTTSKLVAELVGRLDETGLNLPDDVAVATA